MQVEVDVHARARDLPLLGRIEPPRLVRDLLIATRRVGGSAYAMDRHPQEVNTSNRFCVTCFHVCERISVVSNKKRKSNSLKVSDTDPVHRGA